MKLRILDKIGTLGAFLAAAACPACFPLLAFVGSIMGLGLLGKYEGLMVYVFQGFVLMALIGNVIYYFSHKKVVPLVIAVISTGLILFSLYIRFIRYLVYAGLFGLLITAVLNLLEYRRCKICGIKKEQ